VAPFQALNIKPIYSCQAKMGVELFESNE